MDDISISLEKIIDELVKKSQEIGNKSWLTSKKWKLVDVINNLKKCVKELKEL